MSWKATGYNSFFVPLNLDIPSLKFTWNPWRQIWTWIQWQERWLPLHQDLLVSIFQGLIIRLLRLEHARQQVTGNMSCHGDRSLLVYTQVGRLSGANCDTSRRQVALCEQENFCKNLCLCSIILSPQQIAYILSDLIFWGNKILLQRPWFSQKFSS